MVQPLKAFVSYGLLADLFSIGLQSSTEFAVNMCK